MKAYFSRVTPFYLIGQNEIGDHESFDAYPVDVDPQLLMVAQGLRGLVKTMERAFENNPAPEECAQAEADLLDEIVKELADG